MKTPTVKVEPTVKGPRVGALFGQLVAVVEGVIHTVPVPVNPAARADGSTYEGTSRETPRTRGRMRRRRLFKKWISPLYEMRHYL